MHILEKKNEQRQRGKHSTRRNKDLECSVELCTRRTPSKLVRVINEIVRGDVAKENAVQEIGFGGFLNLRCIILRHQLCEWLIKQCDPLNSALRWSSYILSIKDTNVGLMFGIPCMAEEVILDLIHGSYEIKGWSNRFFRVISLKEVENLLHNVVDIDD